LRRANLDDAQLVAEKIRLATVACIFPDAVRRDWSELQSKRRVRWLVVPTLKTDAQLFAALHTLNPILLAPASWPRLSAPRGD